MIRKLICFTFLFISDVKSYNTSYISHLTRHETSEWNGLANHPAWQILDAFDCGESAADRIIGGINAALGQFPWIVRLGYFDPDGDELDWMCGGTLVTDKHVVTAAHCIRAPHDDYTLKTIRFGEYDIRTDPDCQLGVCAPPIQDRKVKQIIVHQNFNNPTFQNDIAVIVLESPVQINDYVTPICLPRKEQIDVPLQVGEMLVVAGWGKMNMTTEERAEILQVVSLPVINTSACDTFGESVKLAKSQICAGTKLNKDACGGDSGGPLMKVFDTAEGPKEFLVGVVSFGPTICGSRKPGIYSFVPYFLEWILDQLLV